MHIVPENLHFVELGTVLVIFNEVDGVFHELKGSTKFLFEMIVSNDTIDGYHEIYAVELNTLRDAGLVYDE